MLKIMLAYCINAYLSAPNGTDVDFANFEVPFSSWTCVHSCLTCVRLPKECSVGKTLVRFLERLKTACRTSTPLSHNSASSYRIRSGKWRLKHMIELASQALLVNCQRLDFRVLHSPG